MRKTTNNSQSR